MDEYAHANAVQRILNRKRIMTAYMEYVHDDTGVTARWWGGEYIEFGYVAQQDTGPFNNLGQPSHAAGEWIATDVINVWDHAAGEARIPFTLEALEQEVIDHLDEEGML